jgi:hypothetical protein
MTPIAHCTNKQHGDRLRLKQNLIRYELRVSVHCFVRLVFLDALVQSIGAAAFRAVVSGCHLCLKLGSKIQDENDSSAHYTGNCNSYLNFSWLLNNPSN